MAINYYRREFEKWIIVWSNIQDFTVIDVEEMKELTFLGEESEDQYEKFDELGIEEYLDEFYNSMYDESMQKLTKENLKHYKKISYKIGD